MSAHGARPVPTSGSASISRATSAASARPGAWPAVGAQQPGVHLLLREGRLPPAEVADGLGAVREGFPCPEPEHPRHRRRIPRGPVHRPRLLLHHPQPAAAAGPVQVVVERLEVRMPLAQEARLLLRRRLRAVHQEAQRVAVPGREVQVGGERMMVEAGRPPHEVVEDRGVGTPADFVALDAVEAHHLIGAEPAERQDVGRIRLGDGAAGQPDPVEVGRTPWTRTRCPTRGSAPRRSGSVVRTTSGTQRAHSGSS